jgi:hypothetical protein
VSRRDWPERQPRPKVQRLSPERKETILATLVEGIEASPVLSALGIRARALRGRFYLERLWEEPREDPVVEVIGRITPLTKPKNALLLETEYREGSWTEIARGSAQELIDRVAGDTKGAFHGLGVLDNSIRASGGGTERLAVAMQPDRQFVYTETGRKCSVQEALYHFFEIPIPVVAEPSQWIRYRRSPVIVEVNEDRSKILVRFSAESLSGESFGGTCLYARVIGDWNAYTIKPNQSRSIASAEAWLEKRKWEGWG